MTIVARAPVRISLGGGGTDLAAYYERHGGFVVSAAITRYCRVAVRPSPDGSVVLTSADFGARERFLPDQPPPIGPLSLPIAAVGWAVEQGWLGRRGVELDLAADVPPGSGLGSSSAMAVALVHALARHAGTDLAPGDAAALACRLEIDRLACPIGKQDQYASAFGGLNAIAFHSGGEVDVTPLSLPLPLGAALRERLLLFSTGQTRDSAAILREQRAATAADQAVVDRLHQLKALAFELRDALVMGELDRFGALLDQGWRLKRGLSRGVSNAAIDRYYAAARTAGAQGGKITGAGGGGFLLLCGPPAARSAIRRAMAKFGLRELPFEFECRGAWVANERDADASRPGPWQGGPTWHDTAGAVASRR